MLHKIKSMKGYKLDSLDGEIGKVKEFYFDDRHWTIRYLIADSGDWLAERQVLLSPHALVAINDEMHSVSVNLTKKQIEDSPSLNSDKPVSRQFEEDYYGYYGWPAYWGGSFVWGANPYIARDREKGKDPSQDESTWDPDLRSTHDVTGYHVQAKDEEIGHVEDFIIDDDTWTIRYLIINTQHFWPGKKILISSRWIDHIVWSDSKVFVDLLGETIRQSPEYTDLSLLNQEYEKELHMHYKQPVYWDDTSTFGKPPL